MGLINLQNIIEGCLLGDGHIEINKSGVNGSFKYRSSSYEHVKFVHSFFKEFCSKNFNEPKKSEYFDRRTQKKYVSYYFNTLTNEIFTTQQKRFYRERVKIIPKDLVLNPINLLFWYIGDGELETNYGYIKLHTNSFSKDEVIFLNNQLTEYDSNLLKKRDGEYLVRIPRRKVKDFLFNIGECPISDYNHKWDFVEYKNKNIELNGFSDYSEKYLDIVNEFKSNNVTIYALHKKYGVPIKCIKNHFNRNKIKWNSKKMSKKIGQYDLCDNLITIWDSGSEIKNKLNFTPSAISECCRGKRNKYKNFKWKFIENEKR